MNIDGGGRDMKSEMTGIYLTALFSFGFCVFCMLFAAYYGWAKAPFIALGFVSVFGGCFVFVKGLAKRR